MDVSSFCKPVSDESPCGPNLEDSAAFIELDAVAHPRSRDQFSAPPEPDWPAVRSLAETLLGDSIDIRILVEFSKALVRTEGIAGACQAIGLLRCIIETFWADLHPRLLDEDGEYDPQIRLNALAEFGNKDEFLRFLREAPLVRSKGIGTFSFRDIQLATGQLKLPEGSEATTPDPKIIEAAFQECDAEMLQRTQSDLERMVGDIKAIRNFLALNFPDDSANFGELPQYLERMSRAIAEYAAGRGLGTAPADGSGAPEGGAEMGEGNRGAMAQTPAIPGEIRNRADVEEALDRIIAYYRDHEPSSPIPLLLLRAKRMVTMDFMAILQDVAEDAVHQARKALGVQEY